MIGPIDAALLQIFSEGFDGTQEFALFHGEGADGEVDGRSFGEQQQGFEQSERILAAGERYGHAIAIADHFEPADGFTDFAQ